MDECTLDDFLRRRRTWVDCLDGDDENSVRTQIIGGVVDAVTYRLSIRLRNLAPAVDGGDGIELNGMFFRMLDRSFFHAHTAAIRRLTDRAYPLVHEGGGRDRSVTSLGALVVDMRQWAPQMTREWLMSANSRADVDTAWRREEREVVVDWLCGTDELSRTPEDHVRAEFFDFLLSKLDASCSHIHVWATKHVAHSASPASREDVEDAGVTWLTIWDAYRALAEVAHILRVWILEGAHLEIMPVIFTDVAQYLDRPLTGTQNLPELRELWDSSDRETDAWPLPLGIVKQQFRQYCQSAGV